MAFCASALQWSADIRLAIKRIARVSRNSAVAVFCSGTFETIRKTAGLRNFLPIASELESDLVSNGFGKVYTKKYRLNFKTTREAFRYIKKCGVSGGERRLGFQESINLFKKYPLDFLEFEVVFGFRGA